MNLTLDEINAAVGGTLEGPGNVKVKGYSIDSRTLKPGEVFVAIKGPKFDGHQFVKQAFERKAAGVVVESPSPGASRHPLPGGEGPTITVRSTVEALQNLARDVRRRWNMPIIG